MAQQHDLSARRAKRWESKKKKAAAFLELVGHNRHDDQAVGNDKNSVAAEHLQNDCVDNKIMETNDKSAAVVENAAEGCDTKQNLSEDVLLEMKKIIRERKKQAMQKPKVFLTLEEMVPFRSVSDEPLKDEELPPLYVMDLQQLVLYGIQGNFASFKPRWCKLLRVGKVSSVVLILLDGLSYEDFTESSDNFPYITNAFSSHVEMVCPLQYSQTIDNEIYNVSLSISQLKKTNVRVPDNIKETVRAKIGQPLPERLKDTFSRTCLLLSTKQMMAEGYPLPVSTKRGKYRNFVFTKEKYTDVTPKSPMFALDCEMCLTTAKVNELTRVSIVSEKKELIYDTLVKPYNRIINYLTRFSGITKAMLDPVTTRIEDVQRKIQELLPSDAILCGQSLNGDLIALKMFHPYVVDTSVIFNMSGNRYVKAGLRKLTQFFLGRTIQNSTEGHCSAEDATATLDLVKLKLSKGLEFGDATMSGVYFPDVKTYFMGGSKESGAKPENFEEETKQPVNSRNLSTCLSTSVQPNSIKNDAGSRISHSSSSSSSTTTSVSLQIPHKRNHEGEIIKSIIESGSSSSSSSSSSSENSEDEDCDCEGEQSASNSNVKKRKLCESGSDVPDSKQTTPTVENPLVVAGKEVEGGSECPSLEKRLISTTASVQEQKLFLFNQQNSVHVNHSFFQLTHEAGRTSCVIDNEAITTKYSSEPIDFVTVPSDHEARQAAKAMVQSKEFVWVNFHEFQEAKERGEITQQRKQKLMRKMDHRVRSVLKKVKPNALVVAVMTGRIEGDDVQNMATFMKIT